MLLAELFRNQKTDYQGDWSNNDELFTVTFTAGDRDIDVSFEKLPRNGEHWELAFQERPHDKTKLSSMEVTGSGHEFEVFNNVIAITKQFLADNDIDTLTFTANKSNQSRAKLYDRLVKRLGTAKWKPIVDLSGDKKAYFTLEKK